MEALPKKPAKSAADKPAKKAPAKKPAVAKEHAAKPAAHAPKHEVKHGEKPAVTAHVEKVPAATEEVVSAVKVPHGKHFYAVGRRKTAVAQAVISAGTGAVTINTLAL